MDLKSIFGVGFAIVVIVFVAVSGMGIADALNPKSSAEATSITLQAEQAAQDAVQSRAQQQTEWELAQSQREQTGAQWVALVGLITDFTKWYLVIGFGVVILLFSAGFGVGVFRATTGIGEAVRIYAIQRASLVYPDPQTGLFPVIVPQGKLFAANINSGLLLPLDQTHEPDIRAALAFSQVQMAGVVSRNAAQAKGNGVPEVLAVGSNLPTLDLSIPALPRVRRAANHRPKAPPAPS